MKTIIDEKKECLESLAKLNIFLDRYSFRCIDPDDVDSKIENYSKKLGKKIDDLEQKTEKLKEVDHESYKIMREVTDNIINSYKEFGVEMINLDLIRGGYNGYYRESGSISRNNIRQH